MPAGAPPLPPPMLVLYRVDKCACMYVYIILNKSSILLFPLLLPDKFELSMALTNFVQLFAASFVDARRWVVCCLMYSIRVLASIKIKGGG